MRASKPSRPSSTGSSPTRKPVVANEPMAPSRAAREPLSRTINVRVSEAVYLQLQALAEATDRTKSFLALEALTTYLSAQSWQVQDIEAGLAEADQNEFATEAEVESVFSRYAAPGPQGR